MKTNGKKAQISSTLTWMVAFLIISFVLVLFLGATVIFSSRQGITISENKERSFNRVGMQRVLSFYAENMKEEIKSWADTSDKSKEDILRKEINELLQNYDFECSVFRISADGKTIEEVQYEAYAGMRLSQETQQEFLKREGYTPRRFAPETQQKLLERGASFLLFSDAGRKIKLELYGGACLN